MVSPFSFFLSFFLLFIYLFFYVQGHTGRLNVLCHLVCFFILRPLKNIYIKKSATPPSPLTNANPFLTSPLPPPPRPPPRPFFTRHDSLWLTGRWNSYTSIRPTAIQVWCKKISCRFLLLLLFWEPFWCSPNLSSQLSNLRIAGCLLARLLPRLLLYCELMYGTYELPWMPVSDKGRSPWSWTSNYLLQWEPMNRCLFSLLSDRFD